MSYVEHLSVSVSVSDKSLHYIDKLIQVLHYQIHECSKELYQNIGNHVKKWLLLPQSVSPEDKDLYGLMFRVDVEEDITSISVFKNFINKFSILEPKLPQKISKLCDLTAFCIECNTQLTKFIKIQEWLTLFKSLVDSSINAITDKIKTEVIITTQNLERHVTLLRIHLENDYKDPSKHKLTEKLNFIEKNVAFLNNLINELQEVVNSNLKKLHKFLKEEDSIECLNFQKVEEKVNFQKSNLASEITENISKIEIMANISGYQGISFDVVNLKTLVLSIEKFKPQIIDTMIKECTSNFQTLSNASVIQYDSNIPLEKQYENSKKQSKLLEELCEGDDLLKIIKLIKTLVGDKGNTRNSFQYIESMNELILRFSEDEKNRFQASLLRNIRNVFNAVQIFTKNSTSELRDKLKNHLIQSTNTKIIEYINYLDERLSKLEVIDLNFKTEICDFMNLLHNSNDLNTLLSLAERYSKDYKKPLDFIPFLKKCISKKIIYSDLNLRTIYSPSLNTLQDRLSKITKTSILSILHKNFCQLVKDIEVAFIDKKIIEEVKGSSSSTTFIKSRKVLSKFEDLARDKRPLKDVIDESQKIYTIWYSNNEGDFNLMRDLFYGKLSAKVTTTLLPKLRDHILKVETSINESINQQIMSSIKSYVTGKLEQFKYSNDYYLSSKLVNVKDFLENLEKQEKLFIYLPSIINDTKEPINVLLALWMKFDKKKLEACVQFCNSKYMSSCDESNKNLYTLFTKEIEKCITVFKSLLKSLDNDIAQLQEFQHCPNDLSSLKSFFSSSVIQTIIPADQNSKLEVYMKELLNLDKFNEITSKFISKKFSRYKNSVTLDTNEKFQQFCKDQLFSLSKNIEIKDDNVETMNQIANFTFQILNLPNPKENNLSSLISTNINGTHVFSQLQKYYEILKANSVTLDPSLLNDLLDFVTKRIDIKINTYVLGNITKKIELEFKEVFRILLKEQLPNKNTYALSNGLLDLINIHPINFEECVLYLEKYDSVRRSNDPNNQLDFIAILKLVSDPHLKELIFPELQKCIKSFKVKSQVNLIGCLDTWKVNYEERLKGEIKEFRVCLKKVDTKKITVIWEIFNKETNFSTKCSENFYHFLNSKLGGNKELETICEEFKVVLEKSQKSDVAINKKILEETKRYEDRVENLLEVKEDFCKFRENKNFDSFTFLSNFNTNVEPIDNTITAYNQNILDLFKIANFLQYDLTSFFIKFSALIKKTFENKSLSPDLQEVKNIVHNIADLLSNIIEKKVNSAKSSEISAYTKKIRQFTTKIQESIHSKDSIYSVKEFLELLREETGNLEIQINIEPKYPDTKLKLKQFSKLFFIYYELKRKIKFVKMMEKLVTDLIGNKIDHAYFDDDYIQDLQNTHCSKLIKSLSLKNIYPLNSSQTLICIKLIKDFFTLNCDRIENTLKIDGGFIYAKDIQDKFNEEKDVTKIIVKCFWFCFNYELSFPGVDFILITLSHDFLTTNTSITLSGRPGAKHGLPNHGNENTKHGLPGNNGNPGQCSGSFIAVSYTPFIQERIVTIGGNGGDGQDGGNGVCGADGEDALPLPQDRDPNDEAVGFHFEKKTEMNTDYTQLFCFKRDIVIYENPGSEGEPGGNAGTGGDPGSPGEGGYCLCIGEDKKYKLKKGKMGIAGKEGQCGRPGIGGNNGKSSYLVWDTKDKHWKKETSTEVLLILPAKQKAKDGMLVSMKIRKSFPVKTPDFMDLVDEALQNAQSPVYQVEPGKGEFTSALLNLQWKLPTLSRTVIHAAYNVVGEPNLNNK
eukprot:TRINITY_DN4039_c0_g1_i2.p1 TRINITY_DN4039_c0_g1~~TRINITY_DN4039_c0_g1_i2.p1  ORF type:complete len:2022 (+),score=540.40 TRINITY_DN4039_c0_g1_i2:746-6067(+)